MHHFCSVTGRDGSCLMEERNLQRYRFLARTAAVASAQTLTGFRGSLQP